MEVDMSLLVAILTASVFAVFALPYQHYQCWFSFSRVGTIAGTFLYLLLAGGGGGAVGWVVPYLAKADPTGNPVLNGVLYGIAGALAMRADFAAGPRPDTSPRVRPPSPGSAGDQLAGARSALTLGIKWTTTLLDVVAARRAEAWLITLTDAELSQEALRVQADITGQPGTVVSDTIKKRLFTMLVTEMEHLNEDNDRIRLTARAQLIGFCTRYYTQRHLAKTPHGQTRRTGRTPPPRRTQRARGQQPERA
jgi:hypothetical protein